MIETCPPIHNTAAQQQAGFRQQPQSVNLVNNMMKIMHKKGLINDLARVPLYMDLSCTKCIDTINTILKPLETMTKTLNISARKPFAAASKSAIRITNAPQSGCNVNQTAITNTTTVQVANTATSGNSAQQGTNPGQISDNQIVQSVQRSDNVNSSTGLAFRVYIYF
jgi:hypothetical protein